MSLFAVLLLAMAMLLKSSDAESIMNIRGGRRRELIERAQFDVQLYFDLQFVDESLALDFETLDDTNPNVLHFCRAIQTQVSNC